MRDKTDICISVLDPSIAKRLFNEGYELLNFKPNKYNRDATVFYFRDGTDIRDRINELKLR